MSWFRVLRKTRSPRFVRDIFSSSTQSTAATKLQRQSNLGVELLEPRLVLSSTPLITEFMASNDGTLADGDGNFSDWIEVHNPTNVAVDLAGWHLTDNDSDLNKWEFPALPQSVLDPGEYLVVFASNQNVDNYVDPSGNLHTTFRLSASGEYLALTMPDESIAHEYSPEYPVQFEDVSYGLAETSDETTLVGAGADTEIFIPLDDNLGSTWTETSFIPDGAWITESEPGVTATTGVGFTSIESVPNLVSHWPLNEAAGTSGIASVEDSTSTNNDGTPVGGVTFGGSGANAFTGTAADFANGSIDVPLDVSMNPASFTLTAWARPTVTSGFQSVVTNRQDPVENRGFILYSNNSGNWSFWTGDGGSGWDTLDGPAVNVDTWQHLTISYDAATDTKRLYVNGVLEASDTGGNQYLPNQIRDLHIGGGGDLGDEFRFAGQIDDVALFDAALDLTAIQTYMANGVPESAEADFGDSINTDLTDTMQTVSASAYIRVPFQADDPTTFDQLTLRMKYDDGFAAYLNGTLIASRNAPGTPTASSTATDTHSDSLAVEFENIDISDSISLLQTGDNILAIHGLNIDANDGDFLIVPELVGQDSSSVVSVQGYFQSPSPGATNPDDVDEIGPIIGTVSHGDVVPTVSDPLIVTAAVSPVVSPITDVTLHYRVMYGSEVSVLMVDNGTNNDVQAGDGIYTGVIPAGVASAGEMLRYFVTAEDTSANERRAPDLVDQTGNKQSAEYFGTVIVDPGLSSGLPIFQWFTANESASHTRSGTRASVFYDGEFYDNVFVRQRGGFTNGATSQKFVFDQTHEFLLSEEAGRVSEININGSGADSSYIRQTLAFETFQRAESAASVSFLTMMQVNGGFDRVGIVIEQVDEKFLERNEFDPEGALYKFVQRSNLDPVFNDTITGIEKKTRLNEGISDLQALVDGLNLSDENARHNFIFDNLDLAQIINYLAVRAVIQDADDLRKNFYMYRDTNGTREWSIFPWDKDFTFNVVGDGGSFLEHPFFGDEEHKKQNANQWNVLYDVLFEDPTTQEMYLRRLRSLMDQLLEQSPGFFEQRTEQLFAPADPHPGPSTSGKNSVLSYFPERRNDLYNTFGPGSSPHVPGEQIPTAQAGIPTIDFGTFEHNPASANQDQEYIQLMNPNAVAVDISGWKLAGGISHTFSPGTVIPANGSLYVTPDASAFRNRTTGPGGGQGLFVQQWDSGHLSNFGETVELLAVDDTLVDTLATPVDPSPEQLYLRISEINYHPHEAQPHLGEADVDNDFFEFIEFVNSSTTETIDLAGVKFSDGLDFEFGSAPTSSVLNVNFNSSTDGFSYQDDLFNGTNNTAFASGTRLPNDGPANDGALQVFLDDPTTLGNRGAASGGWTKQFTLDQEETVFVSLDFRMILAHAFENDEFGEAILEINGTRLGNDLNNALIHTSGDGQSPTTLPVDSGWLSETFQIQLSAGTHTLRIGGFNNKSTFEDENAEFLFDNIVIQTQEDLPPVLLLPGERILVVRDQSAFESRYGAGLNIAGEFANGSQLSNGGEKLKLNDVTNSTIHEFTYDDFGDWPLEADGQGSTLEVIDTAGDYNDAFNWQASSQLGGTPGLGEVSESGDFDGDGDVDGADFLSWQRGFGLTGGATSGDGDGNGDGKVDGLDLSVWQSELGNVGALVATAVDSTQPISAAVDAEISIAPATDPSPLASMAALYSETATGRPESTREVMDRAYASYFEGPREATRELDEIAAAALLSPSDEVFATLEIEYHADEEIPGELTDELAMELIDELITS